MIAQVCRESDAAASAAMIGPPSGDHSNTIRQALKEKNLRPA